MGKKQKKKQRRLKREQWFIPMHHRCFVKDEKTVQLSSKQNLLHKQIGQ